MTCNELHRKGIDDKGLPTEKQIEKEIEQVVDSLHDETFDSIAVQVSKHHVAYQSKHLDPSAVNQMTRLFLTDSWKTLEGKLSVVLGKEALKAIRRRVQEVWNVSFSNLHLVEAMTVDEIDPEINGIIARLEAL